MRVFPKRYDLLLTQIIEVLAEQQGADGAGAVIEAAARKVAARARERPQGGDEPSFPQLRGVDSMG
jgi:predicted ArsR family transcriptional regulator